MSVLDLTRITRRSKRQPWLYSDG